MKAGEALCPGHSDAPAAPQSSAPVVACNAFCGMTHAQLALDAQASKDWIADPGYSLPDNRIRWCSPTCRDARLFPVPPLAAQLAEAKRQPCCVHAEDSDFDEHDDDCPAVTAAKPAEQPKPAKAHDFSDPYCATKTISGRPMRMCVACGEFECDAVPGCEPQANWRAFWEAELAAGNPADILRDPAIPERLPRPRLAHVAGMHDDDLAGGGR
jgi:hypothetical protein